MNTQVGWFDWARSQFIKTCEEKQLYHTLCLLGACEIRIDSSLPALAAMSNVKALTISFHPNVEQLATKSQAAFDFLMFHEVRHIIQSASLLEALSLPDLSPLLDKAAEMEALATTSDAKQRWREWAAQLSDLKNPQTRKLVLQAVNIGMDAAVNRDAVKLFGDKAMASIDSFSLDSMPEKLKEKVQGSGGAFGCITVDRLSEWLKKPLAADAEWLYYANEYLRHMADEQQSPDDAPERVPVSFDDHDGMGGNSEDEGDQAEAQKRSSAACQRAAEEAKFRAEKAGRGIGDSGFDAENVPMDRKVQRLVDAMKFKVKRILMPSPEEYYTYARPNRLWPHKNLPGTENVLKPRPAVALVIDVSGSCWRGDWLNQMVAVARHLAKKKMLAGMWSFDTELAVIPFDSGSIVRLRGGGGTWWTKEMTDEVLKKLGTTKMDMILMSDMYIDGLEELAADKRVILHPIDITKYLE